MGSSRLSPLTLCTDAKLVSEANTRGHWGGRHGRGKAQKSAVFVAWLRLGRPTFEPPARVLITRIGPRRLDSDNLAGSAKAVRDEIADRVLRTDDWAPSILLEYDQRKSQDEEPKYACIVEIMPWSGYAPK